MPTLLKQRDIVTFTERFPDAFERKTFEVRLTQQVPYSRQFFLDSGQTFIFDMKDEDDGGFEPVLYTTLYEILVSIRCPDILGYVLVPDPRYLNRLEQSNFFPEPANDMKRYIGPFTQRDSEVGNSKMIIHYVRDQTPVKLKFFNDSPLPGKIELVTVVNRCRIDRKEIPTDDELKRARVIVHPDIIRGEFGG